MARIGSERRLAREEKTVAFLGVIFFVSCGLWCSSVCLERTEELRSDA